MLLFVAGGPCASLASPNCWRRRRAGPRLLVDLVSCSRKLRHRGAPRNIHARKSRQRAARLEWRHDGAAGARWRAPITSGWRFCCVCGRCGRRRPKFMLNLLASHIRADAMGRKASRPGCAMPNLARYSGFTSARFPQGTKKGSGITDNCHCRTSELLIVTATRAAGRIGLGHAQRKWRPMRYATSTADARNERTVLRARFAHGAISARRCARNKHAAAPGRR